MSLTIFAYLCLVQAETCSDGRVCSEVERYENPCIVWDCSSLCSWGDPSVCEYQLTPGQDECPVAVCSPAPPAPPIPKNDLILTVVFALTGILVMALLAFLGWKYSEKLKRFLVGCSEWLLEMLTRISSVPRLIRRHISSGNVAPDNNSVPLDNDQDSNSDDTRSSIDTPTSPEASPTLWARYRTMFQNRSNNNQNQEEQRSNDSLLARGRRYFQRFTSNSTSQERQPLIRFRRVQDGQNTVEMADIVRHDEEDQLDVTGIQNENASGYNDQSSMPIIRRRTPPPPYQT